MTDQNGQLEIKADLAVTEAGEITGIAWPFGAPDQVGDTIVKGAFDAPASLPMFHEHNPGETIGLWSEIKETAEGLVCKGRLAIHDVPRAREVADQIRSGALGGLSIGFVAKSAQRHTKGRTIRALSLREISVVKTPCNEGATVLSLKSAPTIATGEHSLMELEAQAPAQAEAPAAAAAAALDTKAFDAMKARLDALEAKAARPGATAQALTGDDETKSFVTYVRTGAVEQKALTYGGTSGAVLAPETTANSILEKVAEFSPVRSLAQVIAMGGPLLQLPKLVNEVDPVEVAETAARTEDEPSFEQIDLKPYEMGVIVPVSRILLEDAQINLDAYLTDHIARRFGQVEARWFVRGNGTSQAEGLLTNAEIAETETTVSDLANGLVDAYYAVPSAYASRGAWLMPRSVMAVVRKLRSSMGEALWEPALAAGQPPTILGRPVYEAVDMDGPVAGNTVAIFGDFHSGYAIADRTGLSVLRDEYTGAANGIVKLHARRRVGGRVILPEALHKLALSA